MIFTANEAAVDVGYYSKLINNVAFAVIVDPDAGEVTIIENSSAKPNPIVSVFEN